MERLFRGVVAGFGHLHPPEPEMGPSVGSGCSTHQLVKIYGSGIRWPVLAKFALECHEIGRPELRSEYAKNSLASIWAPLTKSLMQAYRYYRPDKCIVTVVIFGVRWCLIRQRTLCARR